MAGHSHDTEALSRSDGLSPTRSTEPCADLEWPVRAYERLDDPVTGLQLLRLLVNMQRWVHRRVETVEFHDDRLVHRRVSVDFTVPACAPELAVGRERSLLIPLTTLRKDTLVNFSLRDEHGGAMPLISLRQTQAITCALLSAWYRIVVGERRGLREWSDLPQLRHAEEQYLGWIARGTQEQTIRAWNEFRYAPAEGHAPEEGHAPADMKSAYNDPRFRVILTRFADNFVLLVPVQCEFGKRRTLKFSYDEPLSLEYFATPPLDHPDRIPSVGEDSDLDDEPPQPVLKPFADRIGLSATPIRFPVPAAEHCQSYHFEVTAPAGTQIERATLLTDRRHKPKNPIAFDARSGGRVRVNLHAADVPRGSVCYAQIHARPSTDGWIRNGVYASLTSLVLIAVVGLLALTPGDSEMRSALSSADVPLSVLATVVGGLSLLLTRPVHPLAGRLLKGLRVAIATVALLPVVAVIVLLLESAIPPASAPLSWTLGTSTGLWIAACIVTGLVQEVRSRSQRHIIAHSLWMQGNVAHGGSRLPRADDDAKWFVDQLDKIQGIREGWTSFVQRQKSQTVLNGLYLGPIILSVVVSLGIAFVSHRLLELEARTSGLAEWLATLIVFAWVATPLIVYAWWSGERMKAMRRDRREQQTSFTTFGSAVRGASYDKPAILVASGEGERRPIAQDDEAWADGVGDRHDDDDDPSPNRLVDDINALLDRALHHINAPH